VTPQKRNRPLLLRSSALALALTIKGKRDLYRRRARAGDASLTL
jgi:hypothetical protein